MESVENLAAQKGKEQTVVINGKKYLLQTEYGDKDLREIIANLVVSDMVTKSKKEQAGEL